MKLIDYLRCPNCNKNDNLEYQDILEFDDNNKPIFLFHCYNCNVDLKSNELIFVLNEKIEAD